MCRDHIRPTVARPFKGVIGHGYLLPLLLVILICGTELGTTNLDIAIFNKDINHKFPPLSILSFDDDLLVFSLL